MLSLIYSFLNLFWRSKIRQSGHVKWYFKNIKYIDIMWCITWYFRWYISWIFQLKISWYVIFIIGIFLQTLLLRGLSGQCYIVSYCLLRSLYNVSADLRESALYLRKHVEKGLRQLCAHSITPCKYVKVYGEVDSAHVKQVKSRGARNSRS